MEIEELGIKQHLSSFVPFTELSDELLNELANSISESYFRKGSAVYTNGQEIKELFYIRSGAVETRWRNGELYNRLDEGDIFGQIALLRNSKVRFDTYCIEDCLLYRIPKYIFDKLCEQNDEFADFVEVAGEKSKEPKQQKSKIDEVLISPISDLLHREILLVDKETSIQETAKLMTQMHSSSAIVMEYKQNKQDTKNDAPNKNDKTDNQEKVVCGIITDRDLRSRLVAEGLSPLTQVKDLMTKDPMSIQISAKVETALTLMLKEHIHHLPILQHREPIGILHLSDIIRHITQTSIYFIENIFRQNSVDDLVRLNKDFFATFVRMVEEEAESYNVGKYISKIGMSYMQRLAQLAQEELGQAPVPFCLIALGSMAREEQILNTDQDNGIILSDDYNPKEHKEYFQKLAKFISDGLAKCGYKYCKGGIMATNEKWCQPLSVWKDYFQRWIHKPNPERLLQSSIFFDIKCAYGEDDFVEQLQDLLNQEAPKSPLFLAALARNTLNRTPPLGMFRTFIVEKDGKQNDVINLKRRGTAILVDIVRLHSLAAGVKATNTFDRLNQLEEMQFLADGMAAKLRYSMDLLIYLRINQQKTNLVNGVEPNNLLMPKYISDKDKHNLRWAFTAISNAQKFLQFKYPWPNRRG